MDIEDDIGDIEEEEDEHVASSGSGGVTRLYPAISAMAAAVSVFHHTSGYLEF